MRCHVGIESPARKVPNLRYMCIVQFNCVPVVTYSQLRQDGRKVEQLDVHASFVFLHGDFHKISRVELYTASYVE